jgi:hypothetical protein
MPQMSLVSYQRACQLQTGSPDREIESSREIRISAMRKECTENKHQQQQ